MRWLFLLLVVLNVLYYVWSQQQVSLDPKVTLPAASLQGDKGDIRLLSESPLNAGTSIRALGRADGDVCLFLGHFDDGARAAALEQRLLSLDIQSAVQAVDGTGEIDYWVYLAPLASRQASVRQLKELQARKIDSYLIGTGDLANGISLGIFPRMDSAESVMFRLRSAGYEPLMKELPRSHRTFWVRISPQSRRLADEALLQRLAQDFKELQHRLMPCQGIATSGQFE